MCPDFAGSVMQDQWVKKKTSYKTKDNCDFLSYLCKCNEIDGNAVNQEK